MKNKKAYSFFMNKNISSTYISVDTEEKMINKQNLWFITLFSLILVLGVYYLTMGEETKSVFSSNEDKETIQIEETDALVALRVAEDENVLAQIENYQNTILDTTKTLEEKNEAYNNLQVINKHKSDAEEIEKLIKDKFKLKSFIKFDNDQIKVTVSEKNHSAELANNIIRAVQELYPNQMYISVKFQ